MTSRFYLPTDDPGTLLFWADIRSSGSLTEDANGNVSAVATQAGSTIANVSATSGFPVLTAGSLNGFDALAFPSNGLDTAIANPIPANTPVNVFFVGNLPASGSGYGRSGAIQQSENGNDAFGGLSLISTATNTGSVTGYNLFNGPPTQVTPNIVHVFSAYTLDGTTANICIDGQNISSNSQSPFFGSPLAGFSLGWSGADGPWPGLIGEYVVIVGAMTQDRVDKMRGYMAWRWNNQSQLATNDPYKNAAPTVAGGSTAVTLNSDPGAFVTTGQPASFYSAAILAASVAFYSVNGQPAVLTARTALTGSPGGFTVSGGSATFTANASIVTNPGNFAVSSGAAQFNGAFNVSGSIGAFNVSGQPAIFSQNNQLIANSGSFATSGQSATLSQMVNQSPGAFVTTGQPASFNQTAAGMLIVNPGMFNILGSNGNFTANVNISNLSLSINGQPTLFTQTSANSIVGNNGNFATNGQSAIFLQVSTQLPGIFSISGQPATFNQTSAANIVSNPGIFNILGNFNNFAQTIQFINGNVAVNGQPAMFSGSINNIAGKFTIIGSNATIYATNLILNANVGIYRVVGSSIMFSSHSVLIPANRIVKSSHIARIVKSAITSRTVH